MNTIFVDTGAFYALSDAGESTHPVALATLTTLEQARRPLLTTTDVVDEVVTLVRYRLGHSAAVKIGERLLASSWCRVVDVSDEIRTVAWRIFVRYKDHNFSLTDCTSFATMRARHIDDAFSFDSADFTAAGFNVVPGSLKPVRRSRRRKT